MQVAKLRNQKDFYLTPYTVIIEPYIKAKNKLISIFHCIANEEQNKKPLSLNHKIIHLIQTLIYCIPIINSIIHIAVERFKMNKKEKIGSSTLKDILSIKRLKIMLKS